jgi:hypothetical protein
MGEADRGDKGAGSATHAAASAAELVGGAGELGAEDLLPLAIPEAQRRGPGRPRGARNIRTDRTAQVILGRYGDPLIASAALGNMPTLELVQWLRSVASDAGLKLGMTVGDIVRFQEQCRASVMPFVHAKRAAVNEAGDPVLPIIGIGKVQVSIGNHVAAGRSIEDVFEQDQGVIDVTPNVSDGEVSDGEDK